MHDGIKAFSSSDIAKLVGITPVYLNALIQRKLYGIAASISDRHGEIKVRIFSEEDVFGIALVWMLFESGLRTESIRQILAQVVDSEAPDPDALGAAEFIARSEISHLVIIRERAKSRKNPRSKLSLKVERTDVHHLNGLLIESVEKYPTASMLVVPVGATFADVANKIGLMYGE